MTVKSLCRSLSGVARTVGAQNRLWYRQTFDITDALADAGLQGMILSVWDPTDQGIQPRGKQVHRGNRYLANGMAGTGE